MFVIDWVLSGNGGGWTAPEKQKWDLQTTVTGGIAAQPEKQAELRSRKRSVDLSQQPVL